MNCPSSFFPCVTPYHQALIFKGFSLFLVILCRSKIPAVGVKIGVKNCHRALPISGVIFLFRCGENFPCVGGRAVKTESLKTFCTPPGRCKETCPRGGARACAQSWPVFSRRPPIFSPVFSSFLPLSCTRSATSPGQRLARVCALRLAVVMIPPFSRLHKAFS